MNIENLLEVSIKNMDDAALLVSLGVIATIAIKGWVEYGIEKYKTHQDKTSKQNYN